jgi:hypothetical protein
MSGLPRLHVWQIQYEVTRAGELPPLPTTALHGALARAVYDQVCIAKARPNCAGCPAEPSCAYPVLFEPPTKELDSLRELGVTTEPPRPLAIAPEPPLVPTREEPIAVRPGDRVRFRLVALGKVWDYWDVLRRALRRVGRKGLGGRNSRVELQLEELNPVPTAETIAPTRIADSVTVRFLTPVRLKNQGQIASSIDAPLLLDAIARRAALLAHLDETDWKPTEGLASAAAALHSVASVRLVRVGRYSGRQRRWMLWPGLVGTVRLRGPTLPELMPLLHFGSIAQVGKATTFGFGRYELDFGCDSLGRELADPIVLKNG